MKYLNYIVRVLAITTIGHAGECTFQSIGDPRNGLQFLAQIQVPHLSVQSALGQLQQLAVDGGYELGGELISDKSGQLAFIQHKNRPALVVWAKADSEGRVSLSLKLARDQKADPVGVKSELCGLLGKLQGGEKGEAIAARARTKAGVGKVIEVKADALSAEIGSEVKSAFRLAFWKESLFGGGTVKSGEYEEIFAPIRAKYLGKKYLIDGQIYTASFNKLTNEMELNFLVTVRKGLFGKQKSGYNKLNYQITAILAKDQGPFFLTLSEGNWVKIQGVVTEVRQDGLLITNCKQAE